MQEEKKTLPSFREQIQEFAQQERLEQHHIRDAVGLSRTGISNIFHGKTEPRWSTLQKLGVMYGLNMNWLFFKEGPMFRPATDSLQFPKHLRLVKDMAEKTSATARPDQPAPTEVVISPGSAEVYEKQAQLIETVCTRLAENGADKATIRMAILSIVNGSL